MQKYDAIENGIANDDVKSLREAIGSMCYINRDFSNTEFFEVIKYVESKGIKLKDKTLIGNTISSQKSEFSDEDFAKAIFELKRNFCDDRIKDVETIGKKLYGKKTTPIKTAKPTSQAGTSPNQESQQHSQMPVVIGGLVAVIVILILILFISK